MLLAWSSGDAAALDELMPLVEGELRRLAGYYMRHEKPGHTLQTTALVNEAYLKLIDQKKAPGENRAQFFAIASKIMRRILIDHARTQSRAKRGGGAIHVDLDSVAVLSPETADELLALNEALTKFAKDHPIRYRVFEMRYFGGLTAEETAEALLLEKITANKLSKITIDKYWSFAKAFLRSELYGSENNSDET